MERASIRDKLNHRPFDPFRLVTSSGESYEVKHPEAAWVPRTKVFVAVPSEEPEQAYRAAELSFLHITAVEDLQPS